MTFKLKTSVVMVSLAFGPLSYAAEPNLVMDEVVVTSPAMSDPLTVTTNPKAPRQPVPAHDGADYLKTIPGFSVIRKGGTDGDPVFRGMAGSRMNIMLDGEQILGGCGGRMDPPTAYVFPASYDRITVLKGPQSVTHGAGNSAATVLFERLIDREKQVGTHGEVSVTGGSFGRNDEMAEVRTGTKEAYVRANATRSSADNYKDGNGNDVRSNYLRWSGNVALGWTPNDDTRIELTGAKSDGKAAYADRGMDGAKFLRDNLGLKAEKKNVSSVVAAIEAQLFYNYIDHVMDNYSMRPATSFSVMNPDRLTTGARVAAQLLLGSDTKATVGVDTQTNIHTNRMKQNQTTIAAAEAYQSMARTEDMRFKQAGVFGDVKYAMSDASRVVAGVRVDFHEAQDSRTSASSSTAGQTDSRTLNSYFGRYEQDRGGNAGTTYIGVGHSERTPDYWERMKSSVEGNTAIVSSSFFVRPEKTTQLDVGTSWRSGDMTTSVSAFYGKVTDYILIKWLTSNLQPLGTFTTMTNVAQSRNIDVTTMGAEADMSYRYNDQWKTHATLALVQANNDTDGKPLAQQPPAELRLGANYDDKVYSFGVLWRLVAAQDRYDVGSGNIVNNGVDYGRTEGFGVVSLNGGWRANKQTLVTAGVDNLFNQYYNEALSRGFGTAVSGFTMPANTRIGEIGRNLWLKANLEF